jgi:hypothetical protein
MLVIPTYTNHNRKDANKFRNCNKLIAYAQEGSTALYALSNQDCTNCGSYTKDDVVGISLNGASRKNWQVYMEYAIDELKFAIAAGATIVADNYYDRNRSYNYHTEGYLVEVLTQLGCVERPSGSGVWDCSNSALIHKDVAETSSDECISIEIHNSLVSKLASEVYVAIGSLYASNGEVSDSTYESILDRLIDIVNNPDILRSNEKLLVPLE